MAAKGLAEVIPYKGVKLTSDGLALAKHILRKHRLWETFLVEKLGFGWEEVHPLAEHLEHVQSRELVEKLATYLGSPIHDPHGDHQQRKGHWDRGRAVNLVGLTSFPQLVKKPSIFWIKCYVSTLIDESP